MSEEQEVDETGAETGQAEVEKWKALARKNEEQAKSNAAAAKRLAEIEAANKTQAEKDAEEKAALARERDEAKLAVLRRDAADEAGLPKSWADRLKGSTAEDLLADAKSLAKDLPAPAKTSAATGGRPVPDLRPGALAAGDNNGNSFNADAWIRTSAGYPAT